MASARRSACPVACTLDLIGDRWTLLVVRDLACGKSYYKQFLASPERISTNILANRLSRLVQAGLAEKYLPPDTPGREAYRLTRMGKSLLPILRTIVAWGLANLAETEVRMTVADEYRSDEGEPVREAAHDAPSPPALRGRGLA